MKRRRLGQHYLTDLAVLGKVLSTANLSRSEVVLEVGTGRGVLTKELSRACASVEGYEIDPMNLEATRRAVKAKNVSLHLADAFEVRPKFDVMVSSLPYSRSAEFVEWLSQVEYGRAVVILQEDFVVKITSPPGDRDYRAISAISQLSSDIKLGDLVGSKAFTPQPRVNSRILTFTPSVRLLRGEVLLIKRLFALRRRTLNSALEEVGIVVPAGLRDSRRRVYQLAPREVLSLVRQA